MKVVLDSNVFISGIFWSGIPAIILQAWMKHDFELIITPTILLEYIDVIKRIDTEHRITEQWKAVISLNATLIEDRPLLHLSRDSDDDKFLNAAWTSQADYLVSGDQDLLVLQDQFPITILKPKEFLEILNNN